MTNLDTTFNSPQGWVITDFGFTPQVSVSSSTFIQPDGKIVMAGQTLDNSNNNCIALARYLQNGTLDPAFGNAGLATASIPGSSALINTGLTIHNGNIYVCGYYYPPLFSFFHIYIACFSSNGVLDTNFGISGFQTISPTSFNYGSFVFDNCYSYAIEIDNSIFPNKIVICGNARKIIPAPNRYYVALARLDLTGNLDITFGLNGLVVYNFNTLTDEYANALAISSSGDYFLCGYNNNNITQKFTVYKFDTTGIPVPIFGSNGILAIPNFTFNSSDYASSIKILSGGKLIVGGSSFDSNTSIYSYVIVKLDPINGSFDLSFGGIGFVLTSLSPTTNLICNSIAIQSDSKIVIGGYFQTINNNDTSFSLARYNTDGSLDSSFGLSGNGLINEDIIPSPLLEYGNSVAIQSDGKILLGGVVGEFSDQSDIKYFMLARYLSSPTPTPSPTPSPTPGPTPSPTPSPNHFLPKPIVPICFPAGTYVSTDQGEIPIELIDPKVNTICDNKIVAVTETIMMEKYLVCIEKHALGNNMPDKKTFITKYHGIKYNNKLIEAYRFIGRLRGIYYVKYNGELLYNILMEKHYVININNLKVETLYPKNIVAHLYTNNYSLEEKKNIILKMNEDTIKRQELNKKNSDLNSNYNRLRNINHTRKAYYQNNYLIANHHNKTIRRIPLTQSISNPIYFNIFSRKQPLIHRPHYMGRSNKRFRR